MVERGTGKTVGALRLLVICVEDVLELCSFSEVDLPVERLLDRDDFGCALDVAALVPFLLEDLAL